MRLVVVTLGVLIAVSTNGTARALDLGGALNQLNGALETLQKKPSDEANTPSATSAIPNAEVDADRQRKRVQQDAQEEQKRRRDQQAGEQERQRRLDAKRAEDSRMMRQLEEDEQRRKREEDARAEETRRQADAEMKELMRRDEEYQRRQKQEAVRAQNSREARLLTAQRQRMTGAPFAAPFDLQWGQVQFGFADAHSPQASHNIKSFSYRTKNAPAGTGDIQLVLCEGHGLQKVIWKSVQYDAWTYGKPLEEINGILTRKYGRPILSDDGIGEAWVGGSLTQVFFHVEQYSNQKIFLRLEYLGPEMDNCAATYKKLSTDGF